jgi:uncharacterized protein
MALIDMPLPDTDTDAPFELSLFPLRTVLFPQGLLALKVFEVRYLDLITQCLREEKPFGVVGLREGGEVRASSNDPVALEAVGTLAHLIDVDGDQPGILHVRCRGGQRFALAQPRQADSGLWQCEAMLLDDDDVVAPSPAEQGSVSALNRAIDSMRKAGTLQCLEPYHFDDAGWVADRWCELLPISRAARQKLLELDDPALRLKLVDDFLRQRKVID